MSDRETIDVQMLVRLTEVGSDKVPERIEIAGRRKCWTGIGWVDEGEAEGDEVLVTGVK